MITRNDYTFKTKWAKTLIIWLSELYAIPINEILFSRNCLFFVTIGSYFLKRTFLNLVLAFLAILHSSCFYYLFFIFTYLSFCRPKELMLLELLVKFCLVAPGARENSVLSELMSLSNTGSFHWFNRDCWLDAPWYPLG